MKFSKYCTVLAVATSYCLILGCGGDSGPKLPEGPKGSVKAKVMFEGKQIKVGTLLLDSGKGYAAAAPVSSDGTFALKGPTGADIPAGTYRVGISPPTPPAPPAGAATMPPPPSIEGIPENFYHPDTSGVTVEVKAGKQDIEIVLK